MHETSDPRTSKRETEIKETKSERDRQRVRLHRFSALRDGRREALLVSEQSWLPKKDWELFSRRRKP